MNKFPSEAAEELKKCALSAGHSTAEERFGTYERAAAYKSDWNRAADAFRGKMGRSLSEGACQDLKMMFWYQAWRTANERKGYLSDVERDKRDVERYYSSLLGRRELSPSLAETVKSMGQNIAWYTANTIYGYTSDATRDRANYEMEYSKIVGDAAAAQETGDIVGGAAAAQETGETTKDRPKFQRQPSISKRLALSA